jgi:hypothetical protein
VRERRKVTVRLTVAPVFSTMTPVLPSLAT